VEKKQPIRSELLGAAAAVPMGDLNPKTREDLAAPQDEAADFRIQKEEAFFSPLH
jgi:hypothetical protein